jgi:steroid 5-alpha reductase family enzyme
MDRGFLTKGLFAYSRHPNFAAEQSVWVGIYLWSCYVTEQYYNWSGLGALAYLILFQGSTWFTELLSSRKYPEYSEYRKRVGMFVPGLPSLLSQGFPENASIGLETKKSR